MVEPPSLRELRMMMVDGMVDKFLEKVRACETGGIN